VIVTYKALVVPSQATAADAVVVVGVAHVNLHLSSVHIASEESLRKTAKTPVSLSATFLSSMSLHLISVAVEANTMQLCPPTWTGLSSLSVEKTDPVIVISVPPRFEPPYGEISVTSPLTVRTRSLDSKAPSVLVETKILSPSAFMTAPGYLTVTVFFLSVLSTAITNRFL